jgi:sorbitol-specific phosphotransferase system component IIBC
MGATGAVFSQVLGGTRGTIIALGALALWAIVPGLAALHFFKRRDF